MNEEWRVLAPVGGEGEQLCHVRARGDDVTVSSRVAIVKPELEMPLGVARTRVRKGELGIEHADDAFRLPRRDERRDLRQRADENGRHLEAGQPPPRDEQRNADAYHLHGVHVCWLPR